MSERKSENGLSGNYIVSNINSNKHSVEANLDMVDFCVDKCVLVDGKGFTDFKLSETQLPCMKNCFTKLRNLTKILY